MKKLIAISMFTPPNEAQPIMKIELTTDGAEYLANNPEAKLMDLFGDHGCVDNYWLEVDEKKVYTENMIRYETEPHRLNEYVRSDFEIDPIEKLKDHNFKGALFFEPDYKGNRERMNSFTAKMAADMWAVYSDEPLSTAALNTNQRYGTLKVGLQHVREGIMAFEYENYQQDNKYGEALNTVALDIEKEMDYCHEKIKLIALICGNDFNIDTKVAKLYRTFRNVEDNKINKLNVKTIEGDGSQENTTEEVTGAADPEGERDLLHGEITPD